MKGGYDTARPPFIIISERKAKAKAGSLLYDTSHTAHSSRHLTLEVGIIRLPRPPSPRVSPKDLIIFHTHHPSTPSFARFLFFTFTSSLPLVLLTFQSRRSSLCCHDYDHAYDHEHQRILTIYPHGSPLQNTKLRYRFWFFAPTLPKPLTSIQYHNISHSQYLVVLPSSK